MAWLFLAFIGCRQSYDGPPPEGEGAVVFGRVVGLFGSGIGGVEVCPEGLDVPCASSEGDGDFLVEPLPIDADIVVTMAKDGHLRTAFHHNTALDTEWRKTLMSDTIVDLMTNRVDTEQVPGLGHAMFILWSGPDYDAFDRVEGIAFELVGSSEGERFYQASGGMPDLELVETSSSGSGGVFNLEPGEYALEFTGDGITCEPWFSHEFVPGEPVPVTVFADAASYIDLVCR